MIISIIKDTIFYCEHNNFSCLFLYVKRKLFYDKIFQTKSLKFKTNYSGEKGHFILENNYSHFKVIKTIQRRFTIFWK
jgi:hypothetical protein